MPTDVPLHAVNWIEIPVTDFDRAKAFYSAIYNFEMPEHQMGPNRMGFLLFQQGQGIGGAIVHGDGYIPSGQGTLVYLNGGDDLGVILDRVEGAGGTVLVPKTQISPELGYFAQLVDTEGNRVALHSMG